MILVNLYGAPGAGKSSGAAYIFSELKMRGINAELVTEFAKDKVYEQSKKVFENQAYIFGKQYFRLTRCKDDVDVIVTDSPLSLSMVYNNDPVLGESFNQMIRDVRNSFDDMNYFIFRVKEYNPKGRFQTEKQSDKLAKEIIDFMGKEGISFCPVNGDKEGYNRIIDDIVNKLNKKTKKK